MVWSGEASFELARPRSWEDGVVCGAGGVGVEMVVEVEVEWSWRLVGASIRLAQSEQHPHKELE
jgi:hypothetical protein